MAKTNRQIIEGSVVRDSKDKTGFLLVERLVKHPKYGRTMRRSSKFAFHDAENECKTGNKAVIIESRRYSKTKSWRLLNIITVNKALKTVKKGDIAQ